MKHTPFIFVEDANEYVAKLQSLNAELVEALEAMIAVFNICRKTDSIPGPDLPPSVTEAIRKAKA